MPFLFFLFMFQLKQKRKKSRFISTSRGVGVAVALLSGISAGIITSYYLQQESADRAIYFTPEISTDVAPITQLAIDMTNLSMGVGAVYVRLNLSEIPSNNLLCKETKKLLELADKTSASVKTAQETSQPFVHPVSQIRTGGAQVRDSFTHTRRDNYITDVEIVPVTTCDSTGRCTTENKKRTYRKYDDTDHYWTLNQQMLETGAHTLKQGLEQMASLKPERVSIVDYIQKRVPSKDALGRPITDKEAYLRDQNEWITDGPVSPFNKLSHLDVVTLDRTVLGFYQDLENKFPSNKYPLHAHVNNTCSSCDMRGAPAGYVITREVWRVSSSYAENYDALQVIFSQAPSKITSLRSELTTISSKLEKKEKVSAEEFTAAADKATELYLMAVPDSKIAAPTATERRWYPLGIGVGTALIFGLGFAAIPSYFKNRDYYRS